MTSRSVFAIDSNNRDSGTHDSGSMAVQFNNLLPNQSFYLKLSTFNMTFTAPNVSPAKGNIIQMNDGTVVVTAVIPTGYYRVGGTNDIGMTVANALTLADAQGAGIVLTSNFNNATSRYSFTASKPFKLIFPVNSIGKLLGFNSGNTQTFQLIQTAANMPVLYDQYFIIQISSNNAVTQQVNIPRGMRGSTTCSFLIPKSIDFGQQIVIVDSDLAPQRIHFSRCPTQLSWALLRPNGTPLEQTAEWIATFTTELDSASGGDISDLQLDTPSGREGRPLARQGGLATVYRSQY